MGIYRPTSTATANTPAEAALLADFGDMLSAGGAEVTIVPEIQRVKFAKNFWNCVFGASAALSRLPLQAIFRPPPRDPGASGASAPTQEISLSPESPTESQKATQDIPHRSQLIAEHTVPFLHDALQEMYALGTALSPPSNTDLGLDPDVALRTLRNTSRIHCEPESSHKPSMLVDVEMGRPMELDVVVGEIVRLGRKMGIAMPVSPTCTFLADATG